MSLDVAREKLALAGQLIAEAEEAAQRFAQTGETAEAHAALDAYGVAERLVAIADLESQF
jgi:hypothetical protein